MQSTFAGIEIGKRSVVAHQQGLVTTGHNLANASTEGYSRQRVELGTFEPIYAPQLNREETPGQIGQGVVVKRIERIRDMLLESRIASQQSELGYWDARDKYSLMIEQIYTEPTDVSVRTQMDRFWDAWQELSLRPDDMAARQAVVTRGETLVDAVHERHRRLQSTRDMLEEDIRITVAQVNDLSKQIAGLSEEIVKSRALGDSPNDLMDRRDLLVEKLSKLVSVTIDDRDPDEYMVHTGGLVMVQGGVARRFELATDRENEGYSKIIWSENGSDAAFASGTLGAMVELRDGDVRSEIQSLDTMTLSFTDLVNETHRSGFGLDGSTGLDFFSQFPAIDNIAGNFDRNGDGNYDSSYVYRMTGANELKAQTQVGISGTVRLSSPQGNVEIAYSPTDTVADIVSRINNAQAEVTARLTREGRLELRATPAAATDNPDFVIRHVEDSGEFLSGYSGLLRASGAEGAYDWAAVDAVLALRGIGTDFAVAPLAHPAAWVEVSDRVSGNLSSVAAGFGENGKPAMPGDGSAALAIAGIRHQNVMVGQLRTFDDYFADAVARAGLRGEQAERNMETHAQIAKNLSDMRDSLSGVNMDEELANMIKFQHGYAAAAKFIQMFDSLLDTIINRMGV